MKEITKPEYLAIENDCVEFDTVSQTNEKTKLIYGQSVRGFTGIVTHCPTSREITKWLSMISLDECPRNIFTLLRTAYNDQQIVCLLIAISIQKWRK